MFKSNIGNMTSKSNFIFIFVGLKGTEVKRERRENEKMKIYKAHY